MSQTKQAIRNAWNQANYDQIVLRVPKGQKEAITARASALGKSLNGYIRELIEKDMPDKRIEE